MEPLQGTRRESDGKGELIEKFREHAEGLKTPEVVRKVFDKELAELKPVRKCDKKSSRLVTSLRYSVFFPSNLDDSMSISFPRFLGTNILLRTIPSHMLDKFLTKIATNLPIPRCRQAVWYCTRQDEHRKKYFQGAWKTILRVR